MEDTEDDVKDEFFNETAGISHQFHIYMKLICDFQARVGKEDVLRLMVQKGNLFTVSNDNRSRTVNFAQSKKLLVI